MWAARLHSTVRQGFRRELCTPSSSDSSLPATRRDGGEVQQVKKRPRNFVEAHDRQMEERYSFKQRLKYSFGDTSPHPPVPHETDFLILGGGLMGSSIAYWLRRKVRKSIAICVLERDPAYELSPIMRSAGHITQQHSIPENIQMSQFSAEFLSEYKLHLGDNAPNPHFKPEGFMHFARTEEQAAQLEENVRLQVSCGAQITLYTEHILKKRFPFMNTEGILLASYGLSNEGCFEPWSLLQGFKQYNLAHQTNYVFGEAVEFRFDDEPSTEGDSRYKSTCELIIRLPTGELRQIKYYCLIVAAGAESGHIGRLLRMGKRTEVLSVPIPVEKRRGSIYSFHAPEMATVSFPYLQEKSGVYCRPEGMGGHFVCGRTPQLEDQDDVYADDYVDCASEEYFERFVWPSIVNRVPAFEKCKAKRTWEGDYDFNYIDGNPIIGFHPYYTNLFLCTGFSGKGAQMAPAAGKAVLERITEYRYQTINLDRFSFDRILHGRPCTDLAIA